MLSRVVADGEIGVEVNGEYSGSKVKSRTVSVSTTVPKCRGYGYRFYLDDYVCSASQNWCDWYLYCVNPEDEEQQCHVWENWHCLEGDSDGDTNVQDEFIDLGAWSQSIDECLACYEP